MDSQRENWKWLYVWILPALLFVLTYMCLGCYYGWLDDVLIMNMMRGILSGRAYAPTDQFSLIADIYISAYHHFPTIPWYGISLFFFCYLGVAALFDFLYDTLSLAGLSQFLMVILLSVFFTLILAENVYLVNFTRISILLIGSSLLCITLILHKDRLVPQDYIKLFYYYLLFALGYLIRYTTSEFPIFIGLMFGFLILLQSKKGRIRFAMHISAISFLLLLHFSLIYSQKTPDQGEYDLKRPYIFNLLDGFNMNEDHSICNNPKDSIRYSAVSEWFYYDDEQINIPFLERMGGKNPWATKVLLNWKNNVKAEIVKINGRNENYQAGLNLLDKFILISVFNLLVLFALWWAYFFHGRERIWAIKASVYWLFFYLLFLLAAIFVKYEDRLFAPAAAILLTGDLYFLCSQIKTNKFQLNKIWGGAFIGMFVILSMMRVSIHREIAAEKKSEVKLKEKFIDSINKGFRGKIFLYDLWSQGLLHSSAFKNIYLDPVNLHTVFGDLPYHDFYSHQKYLKKEVCDYDKFIDFYDCVYDKREKVVFVMADFRRQMLQGYMKVLYERSYRFEGISDNSIKKIKYSFIWCPLSFDLCRIAK